ncbi:MAG: hybrid sensor histidine kinase/response regulator, partial [Alphaproteobacteria bacterium]|nr:hybrid sensor histidine kinase/response regulator [Alphaproteobacteria bacterium]
DSLDANSRAHHNLDVICRAGASAKDLVEQISTFSRQQGLIRERANMFEIVRDGLNLIGSTIPATISVAQKLDPDTGFVFVDVTQIQTVLMNLVANAVDSMEGKNGTLNITLSRATVTEDPTHSIPGLEDGDYAKLTIADTGQGMDQETLSKIFDPFFTTKGFGEGTGLGLPSALGIIQKHGATILADSELDAGTNFDVYLPLELSVTN